MIIFFVPHGGTGPTKKGLSTYLPRQYLNYVQKTRDYSQAFLNPIYQRLALAPSTDPSATTPSSEPISTDLSSTNNDSPLPLQQTKTTKTTQSSPTGLNNLGVLVIRTDEDCELSVTNSPNKTLKVGQVKRIPVRFGNHNIVCTNAQNKVFTASLKVSEKRKYKVHCQFRSK